MAVNCFSSSRRCVTDEIYNSDCCWNIDLFNISFNKKMMNFDIHFKVAKQNTFTCNDLNKLSQQLVTDYRSSPNQIRLTIIVMEYSLGPSQSWLLVVIISDL